MVTLTPLGQSPQISSKFPTDTFLSTTFMVDDWITHTPKSVLAKNFGVNASVFDSVPSPFPYILNANGTTATVTGADAGLFGNSSYVYHAKDHKTVPIPGGGGNLTIVDSRNFPISKTLAATIVSLAPGGLRELHWHPNAEEWLYFHSGTGRATVFIGGSNARTFDFSAGDTAAFPDNSGHYIENTSQTENLVWIEIYKSDRVADISLTQWLALTPPDIVTSVLKIPRSVVDTLKKEKQILVKG
jgi:oxalate decarboxylase